MCQISKLVYSARYKVNVDLEDFHCTSAKNNEFAKVLPMKVSGNTNYLKFGRWNRGNGVMLFLHRIVADACVTNPRPDIFDVVDHIDGCTLHNDPSNLRWVNSHLNHNNLKTSDYSTPPGVHLQKRKTKSGKWYSYISFTKNGCILKSFRSLQKACAFADWFNFDYFNRLYSAYVNSPRDPYECRLYWAEKAMCVSDFRFEIRASRKLVLGGKFLLSDSQFKKLTLNNN